MTSPASAARRRAELRSATTTTLRTTTRVRSAASSRHRLDATSPGRRRTATRLTAPRSRRRGHACARAQRRGCRRQNLGPDHDRVQHRRRPDCDATLPPTLEALINGEPLDWTLLAAGRCRRSSPNLETDARRRRAGRELPADRRRARRGRGRRGGVQRRTSSRRFSTACHSRSVAGGGPGRRRSAMPTTLAKLASSSSSTSSDRHPAATSSWTPTASGGDGRSEDVVVTPLFGTPAVPSARTAPRSRRLIKDFRVTFKIGQAIDGDVPFDIGLKGMPLQPHRRRPRRRLLEPARRLRPLVQGRPVHRRERQARLRPAPRTGRSTPTERRDPARTTATRAVTSCRTTTPTSTARATPTRRRPRRARHVAQEHEHGSGLPRHEGRGAQALLRRLRHRRRRGVDWNGKDGYELRARHAPDTPDDGGASELQLEGVVSMGDLPATPASRAPTGSPTTSPAATDDLTGF